MMTFYGDPDKLKNSLPSLGTIDPKGKAKITWDFIVFLLIVYLAIGVPLDLAMDTEPLDAGDTFFWWNRVIDCLFLLDVVLTFFTAIEENNSLDLITDRELN